MLSLGVHTHLITAHHALPLLIERVGGLLVEVTDGTAAYNAEHYRINPFYDLAKVSGDAHGLGPRPGPRTAWRDGGLPDPAGCARR